MQLAFCAHIILVPRPFIGIAAYNGSYLLVFCHNN